MKRLYSLPLLVSLCCLMMSCGAGRTLRKAEKHFDYGEYHEAAIQYGKAYRMLTSQERNLRAEAAYHRGLCFQRLNQCVKAENEFKKAIRYALPNDTVHLNLAQVYHESGKIKEAEAAYQAFLEYHPEDVLANNGLLACHKIPEWKQQKSKFVLRKSTHFSSRRGDFSPILIPTEYNSLLYSSSIRLKEGQKTAKSPVYQTMTFGSAVKPPQANGRNRSGLMQKSIRNLMRVLVNLVRMEERCFLRVALQNQTPSNPVPGRKSFDPPEQPPNGANRKRSYYTETPPFSLPTRVHHRTAFFCILFRICRVATAEKTFGVAK